MTDDRSLVAETEEPAWGTANPNRGAKHHEKALAFLARFPVGTSLTPAEFDEWAQHKGYLDVPIGAPKRSDAWKAYLQRRHELKICINKAGTHPRMKTPFMISFVIADYWEVRSPEVAIAKSEVARRIKSLMGTKRKQLAHLLQSADWKLLPPHERAVAEALYEDIDVFGLRLNLDAKFLEEKFAKLRHKIENILASGEIQPQNGGIRAITSDCEFDEDDIGE